MTVLDADTEVLEPKTAELDVHDTFVVLVPYTKLEREMVVLEAETDVLEPKRPALDAQLAVV